MLEPHEECKQIDSSNLLIVKKANFTSVRYKLCKYYEEFKGLDKLVKKQQINKILYKMIQKNVQNRGQLQGQSRSKLLWVVDNPNSSKKDTFLRFNSNATWICHKVLSIC